jgi:hypothetical protein
MSFFFPVKTSVDAKARKLKATQYLFKKASKKLYFRKYEAGRNIYNIYITIFSKAERSTLSLSLLVPFVSTRQLRLHVPIQHFQLINFSLINALFFIFILFIYVALAKE